MRSLLGFFIAFLLAAPSLPAQTNETWPNASTTPLASPALANNDLIPYDLCVYPIPVRSTLHLEFQAPEAGQLQVAYIDLVGRSLISGLKLEVTNAGRFRHDLQLDALEPGNYVLQLVYQPYGGDRPLVLHRRIAVE